MFYLWQMGSRCMEYVGQHSWQGSPTSSINWSDNGPFCWPKPTSKSCPGHCLLCKTACNLKMKICSVIMNNLITHSSTHNKWKFLANATSRSFSCIFRLELEVVRLLREHFSSGLPAVGFKFPPSYNRYLYDFALLWEPCSCFWICNLMQGAQNEN